MGQLLVANLYPIVASSRLLGVAWPLIGRLELRSGHRCSFSLAPGLRFGGYLWNDLVDFELVLVSDGILWEPLRL